mmetsp:Transcript_19194/g.61822  ORF Transcript_19194/g.61822 Transcript_19194/m.61822 type:complete len:219 (-) Transcript_19194:320-976(-)
MDSLRAESASLGAGARCRAESSEQRVSTSDTDTVSTAEYGRVRLSACPLERGCWSARVRAPLLGPAAAASTRCRARGGGWRRAAAARAAGPLRAARARAGRAGWCPRRRRSSRPSAGSRSPTQSWSAGAGSRPAGAARARSFPGDPAWPRTDRAARAGPPAAASPLEGRAPAGAARRARSRRARRRSSHRTSRGCAPSRRGSGACTRATLEARFPRRS